VDLKAGDLRIPLPAAAILITLSVVVATWPFAIRLSEGVTDLGDPLLNSWALAWVAHSFAHAPLDVFNGNIFYPETGTLAYSEPMLAPALLLAPVHWLGGDPILAHNLLVLIGYAGSGFLMFLLVRGLTGQDGAALVAGVMFAVLPMRTEVFAKVQLQMTFWPVALLCLHRISQSETPMRWAMALGVAVAIQAYSGVYVAAYGTVTLVVVGAATWWFAKPGRRQQVAIGLGVGAVTAVILTAPLALAFRSASATVGERTLEGLRPYNAEWRDYRRSHPEQAVWGDPSQPGIGERRLFPGVVAATLGLAGVVAGGPMGAAYGAAAALNAYASRGSSIALYRWAFTHVGPLRAFRVPARFGLLVGLALAVLSGLAVARLSRGRSRSVVLVIVSACVAGSVAEGRIRSPELASPGERQPTVYQWLARQPRGAVCEFPVGQLRGRSGPQDPTYMYYSTRHWQPLVNGYSGFAPPSYFELLDQLAGFPDERSMQTLLQRNVNYLIVHERYYASGNFEGDLLVLKQDARLQWTGSFTWVDHTRSELFRLASPAK
jgi:hypothetical protein